MSKNIKKRIEKIEKKLKKSRGQPTKITEKTLALLEQGFSLGLTDEECCRFARIHPSSLYRYQEKNPKYREEKELIKKDPILKAKKLLYDDMETFDDALKYLKNKCRDEFSEKIIEDKTVEYKINATVEFVSHEDVEKEKKIVDKND